MNIAKRLIITTISGLSLCVLSSGNIYAENTISVQAQNKVANVKSQEELKAIIKRFAKGDKTLKNEEIAAIYYQYKVVNGDRVQKELTMLTDKYIKDHLFEDAQRCAEGALGTLPYDIGLLNRVCDLTQHNKSDKVDLYIWQLASLFHIINISGDGRSFAKAYKVRTLRDAYLFETLWLQNPMNTIKGKEEISRDGKNFYVLSIKTSPESNTITKNYYQIETP